MSVQGIQEITDWKQMKTMKWLEWREILNKKYEGFTYVKEYTWAKSVGVFRWSYQGKKQKKNAEVVPWSKAWR